MGGSGAIVGETGCYALGCGQPGVYGTLGTPALGNTPGGRDGSSTWTDSSGNFWLFGGEGFDASGKFGVLNDLWEFNPSTNEWTWMAGSSTFGSSCFTYSVDAGETNCAQPGTYGTLNTSAVGNIPGSRLGASTWTDSKGNFWLFGGWGYDMNFQLQEHRDELSKAKLQVADLSGDLQAERDEGPTNFFFPGKGRSRGRIGKGRQEDIHYGVKERD